MAYYLKSVRKNPFRALIAATALSVFSLGLINAWSYSSSSETPGYSFIFNSLLVLLAIYPFGTLWVLNKRQSRHLENTIEVTLMTLLFFELLMLGVK
jgi:glycopeptide antibiotics resistance protein